jgi:hypothetical protein
LFGIGACGAEWCALLNIAPGWIRIVQGEPFHCFFHQGCAQMNPPPNLGGKNFESFEPESAGSALLRLR